MTTTTEMTMDSVTMIVDADVVTMVLSDDEHTSERSRAAIDEIATRLEAELEARGLDGYTVEREYRVTGRCGASPGEVWDAVLIGQVDAIRAVVLDDAPFVTECYPSRTVDDAGAVDATVMTRHGRVTVTLLRTGDSAGGLGRWGDSRDQWLGGPGADACTAEDMDAIERAVDAYADRHGIAASEV
jgi:hypothetical protein